MPARRSASSGLLSPHWHAAQEFRRRDAAVFDSRYPLLLLVVVVIVLAFVVVVVVIVVIVVVVEEEEDDVDPVPSLPSRRRRPTSATHIRPTVDMTRERTATSCANSKQIEGGWGVQQGNQNPRGRDGKPPPPTQPMLEA